MNQSNLLYLFKNEIYFYLIEININRGMKLSVSQAVPDAFPERRVLMPIWGGLPAVRVLAAALAGTGGNGFTGSCFSLSAYSVLR